MITLEEKLKKASFWLRLLVINHSVTLMAICVGYVYSVFTGESDSMREVLSIYAFTLLTPQIALEVIVLIALFMVTDSLRDLYENLLILTLFIVTSALLVSFVYWR